MRMNANSLNNAVVLLDADVARAERAQDPLVRTVFHLEHLDLLTKLRPGVREFLQSASVLFDIHINTMGSQEYAEQMVALLDPETKWIKGTVKGLGEMEGGRLWAPSEKVLDGPLEKLVDACLIFDDTASVWASYRENLITCERYLFFAESRRQFGLSGLSLLEVGHDESKEEGMLSTALKVFQSVHTAFFERYDVLEKSSLPNVQSILHEHRMDVLAGVHVVFSRVFPIDMDPTKHRCGFSPKISAPSVPPPSPKRRHTSSRPRDRPTRFGKRRVEEILKSSRRTGWSARCSCGVHQRRFVSTHVAQRHESYA